MSDYEDDFDETAYDEDLRAQNAVDDAKYDTPEQDEPPEGYYDVVSAEDDRAGHTGETGGPGTGGWDGQSWHGFPWPTSTESPF